MIVNIGGKTGVGKTTLINTLNKTALSVDHIQPCTKRIQEVQIKYRNFNILLRDFPGLGISVSKDRKMISLYREELIKCNIFVYVIKADTRYITFDQKYFLYFLSNVPKLAKKVIFCLNQIDKIYPFDWKDDNTPSEEQVKNLEQRVIDLKKRFEMVFKNKLPPIVSVSAKRKYNLEKLLERITA